MKETELPSLKINDIEAELKKITDSDDKPRDSSSEIYYSAVKNAETALKKLIEAFPRHDNLDEIYLKVTAINSLYSTNIYDTYRMAYHIFKNVKEKENKGHIDDRLEKLDPELIHDIASGHGIISKGKEKGFYSFATKYCSFHNPDKYAIYDTLIQDLLIKFYKKQDKGINYLSLRKYDEFMRIIKKLIEDNNLGELKLKQIDMYLWLKGKE